MEHGFIHHLNPVVLQLGNITCYYYGLAYALGFVGVYGWYRWRRRALAWSMKDVYDFSIVVAFSALLGGRLFAVVVYHWRYYQTHLSDIFSFWLGGMASHGVLLGGVAAMYIFSRRRGTSFLRVADEMAIPAAFLLGLGRLGNFVNGQIVGTPTDMWWGVKFPEVDGFRHPVTLYESLKNLFLIPILFGVRRTWPAGTGGLTAHFLLWYGVLRILCDGFREHGAELFGVGLNQYFNAAMAVAGLALLLILKRRPLPAEEASRWAPCPGGRQTGTRWSLVPRAIVFSVIVLMSLGIRSAWMPDVLAERRAQSAMKGRGEPTGGEAPGAEPAAGEGRE